MSDTEKSTDKSGKNFWKALPDKLGTYGFQKYKNKLAHIILGMLPWGYDKAGMVATSILPIVAVPVAAALGTGRVANWVEDFIQDMTSELETASREGPHKYHGHYGDMDDIKEKIEKESAQVIDAKKEQLRILAAVRVTLKDRAYDEFMSWFNALTLDRAALLYQLISVPGTNLEDLVKLPIHQIEEQMAAITGPVKSIYWDQTWLSIHTERTEDLREKVEAVLAYLISQNGRSEEYNRAIFQKAVIDRLRDLPEFEMLMSTFSGKPERVAELFGLLPHNHEFIKKLQDFMVKYKLDEALEKTRDWFANAPSRIGEKIVEIHAEMEERIHEAIGPESRFMQNLLEGNAEKRRKLEILRGGRR